MLKRLRSYLLVLGLVTTAQAEDIVPRLLSPADSIALPSTSNTTSPAGSVEHVKHLFDAAQSLRLAGRAEAADAYQKEAEQLIKPHLDELEAKREQLRLLSEEIQSLERSVGCPSSVIVKFQLCSVASDQSRTLLPRQQYVSGPLSQYLLNEIQDKIRKKLIQVSAESQIVATSGRRASSKSGGEFPIITGEGQTPQTRFFGNDFEVTPTCLGANRVHMELSMEQSERDFSSQVEVAGHVIPGIKTQRVSTQVVAKLGETYFLRNPGEVSFWLIQVEMAEPPRR